MFQLIAKSHLFEIITLTIISLNTLWIAIDVDGNNSESLMNADIRYQIADNFFCSYFFAECLIRFLALKKEEGLLQMLLVFIRYLSLLPACFRYVVHVPTLFFFWRR